ncbi:hypothetical protein HZH66_000671 [Vespula vulgaris]|uniref:Uncharacterized protein n=1 Tax=Vespula vulgaris TaxID=7454 RepID=A0A834KSU8_VESVU|nr:hypothetical protein HZH66_000671 [Vespula vulgaris]
MKILVSSLLFLVVSTTALSIQPNRVDLRRNSPINTINKIEASLGIRAQGKGAVNSGQSTAAHGGSSAVVNIGINAGGKGGVNSGKNTGAYAGSNVNAKIGLGAVVGAGVNSGKNTGAYGGSNANAKIGVATALPYEAEEEKEEEEEEVEEEGRLKWYFASRRIKNEERTRKGEVWWDGEGMILEKEEEEQEETEEDKTVPPPRAKITLKSSSKRFKGLRSGRRKGSPRKKGLTTRWAKASTDYKLGIRVYRMRIPYASSTDFSTLNGACRIREFNASNFSKNATYKFTKAMS